MALNDLNDRIEAIKKTNKQQSWFKTEVDFEKSFKWWFALQWQNSFMQIFIVAFSLLIAQLLNISTMIVWVLEAWCDGVAAGVISTFGVFLPFIVSTVVAYKGFYQYFNDLKNGTSR